ncbi:hypothetical protein FK545_20525 (plasmid) [Planococcus glaciei]|nr:hypothetical protein [Planococcus glaciei]QDY46977.1 hypothetical protein FK545_20525 [Planococcus glaciei]
MRYIIRSSNGVVLMEENEEKLFHNKEEAEEHLSLLQLNTVEDWLIIELKKGAVGDYFLQ